MLALMIMSASCSKKDKWGAGDEKGQAAINRWVISQMQTYYYWNNHLPVNLDYDQDPIAFFNAIKFKDDRFSYIYYKKKYSLLSGTLMNTFGLELEGIEADHIFKTQVLLVVPGSNAAALGLARGMFVKAINGVVLTAANVGNVVADAITQKTLSVILDNNETLNIPAAYIAEPVVYKTAVFNTTAGDVGYLFMNSFEYQGVHDILNVFRAFKEQNIRNLIIDLRYNIGGSVPFSALVSALIAPVQEEQTYVIYKGNATAGTIVSSFENEIGKQPQGYNFTLGQLTSYRPNLQRVYALTSRLTMSAAELMINNLKPYVQVVQIGERTFGKDMASLELKNDKITGLSVYPLCFKLFNAGNKGNYSNGLQPDYLVQESAKLPLLPIGDKNDLLIRQCISLIEGNGQQQVQLSGSGMPSRVLSWYQSRASGRDGAALLSSLPEQK